mmetsp:Transcript_29468/g.79560  ORF Transcript_29468/g.79560 Transcript_29468/m.79560 type:complete len:138 (-) Transcript_29468:49-462(-)
MGRQGLTEAFRTLGMNLRQLDTVVVGQWNDDKWANTYSPKQQICSSFGLRWATNFTPWTTVDFADFLQDMGFSGELVLGGMFVPEGQVDLNSSLLPRYSFSVRKLPPFPVDGSFTGSRHACLPGPPDLVVADLEGWK